MVSIPYKNITGSFSFIFFSFFLARVVRYVTNAYTKQRDIEAVIINAALWFHGCPFAEVRLIFF